MNPSEMNPLFTVSSVKIKIVEKGTQGLQGWASVVICDAIRLNHLALRKGTDGKLFVTYPNKLKSSGKKQGYFFPISTEAAETIQDAILTRLAILAQAAAEDGTPAT